MISAYCICGTGPAGRYPRQVLIVSIGDLLLDIAIVPEGPLQPDDDSPAAITIGGGGQAANFCAWTAALGEPVRLVTRVGDDESGRRLVADLESRGVEVRAVWAAEPTGAIAVFVGPDGRRAMATQRGASVGLSPNDLDDAWFRDVRLLHVPGYSLFVVQANAQPAVEHPDRRGHAMFLPHRSLASSRCLEVVWRGEALADDGGFERDHGPAGLQGRRHFR